MLAGLSAEEVLCAGDEAYEDRINGFNFKLHTFQNYVWRAGQESFILEQAVESASTEVRL